MMQENIYKTFIRIAIPVGLQNLLTYAVNLMDSVMVGSLGEEQLSAVTVATQPFYLFMTFMMSLSSGACVLIAQYYGKKDKERISQIVGFILRIGGIAGFLVSFLVICIPGRLLSLYTNETVLISYGTSYLRIAVFSYIPFALANGYLSCVRSVERVKIALFTTVVSFCVNVFFNYVFIFGKFGAPALGVAGAAVGTVLARLAELLIVVIYAAKVEDRVEVGMKYLLHGEKLLFADFMKIALPVVFYEMIWAVGNSVHNAILGRLGVSAVTTVSIVSTAFQIVTVFIYGAASAILVIVGKYIGAGKTDEAKRIANKLVVATIGVSAVAALFLLATKNIFISFYSITPETRAALLPTTNAAAVVILVYSINMATIVGVFRGGGDTKFAMYLDIPSVWLVAIPLGLLGAFVWKLPIWAVYFLLRSDEVVKAFCCFFHLKGGRWLKEVTREERFANGGDLSTVV